MIVVYAAVICAADGSGNHRHQVQSFRSSIFTQPESDKFGRKFK